MNDVLLFCICIVCAFVLGSFSSNIWQHVLRKYMLPNYISEDHVWMKRILGMMPTSSQSDIQNRSHLANLYRKNGEMNVSIAMRKKC